MKKKLLSWLLVFAMVLGMIPASALETLAAEIPVDAPFTAVSTDAGDAVKIEDMGTVEYSYYGESPYYHVTIPAGATEVYVTHPFSENPFADASYGSAYGYYANTEDWTGGYMTYSFVEAEDGYTITFPLSHSAYDLMSGETVELNFVADEAGYVSHVQAVERSDDFAPIAFFSFEYEEETTEPEVPDTPVLPEEPARTFAAILAGESQIAEEKIAYQGIFKLGDAPEGDEDGYVYIHEVPYYIVEVPLGTENVDIVYNADTKIMNSGSDAYGYRTSIDEGVDAVSSATVKGTTFKNGYSINEDGTQTVTTSAKNNTVNYDGIRWATTAEEPDSPFDAVTLFSFDYPEHEHIYNSVVKDATCEKGGYTTHTCSQCFISYVDSETDALGHDYKAEVTPPTCTADGYTTYTCENCFDSYQADPAPKTGHTQDQTIAPVIKDASCDEDGSTTYTCATCKQTYSEPIPATGHTLKDTIVPATCKDQGYTLHECENCDYELKDTYTELADHSYGNGECSVCGAPEAIDGVYQIATEAQLRWFEDFVEAGNTTANAKLVSDITITNTEAWNGIGTSSKRYAGTFDGDNKTVTIEKGTNGLFAYVKGKDANNFAFISNVTVDGNITSTSNYVGGIAGYAFNVQITNCVNKANVSGAQAVAGIVGYAGNTSDTTRNKNSLTILQCSNHGEISGTSSSAYDGIAGILGGSCGGATIQECYNAGNISAVSARIGGITGFINGYNQASTISDCYNVGNISTSGNAGGLVGYGQVSTTVTNCYNLGTAKYGLFGFTYNNTFKVSNCYFLSSVSEGAAPKLQANFTDVAGKTAVEMSSEEFAVLLGEAYQTSCPAPVFATQTPAEHQLTEGVCTVCGFGSNVKEEYSVNLVNGTGYTIEGAETVAQGENYNFTVNIADGYMEGSDFKVSALGDEVSKNDDGSYTVTNVTGNLTITVEGVVKAEFSITLPKDGNGYSVTPAEGYTTTVHKGAEFKFKVEIKENFQAGSSFTVKANDTVLKETDGIYTIETVTSAQVITVFGVEMVPYEDTVSVKLTISEGTDRFYTSEITDEIMLYQEMEVPYFDLELYGLEKFYYNPYCYLDKDGNPVRQSAGNKETAYGVVTAMHAFIYVTEVYYLGYEPEEACQGISYNTEIEITNEYGETEIVNQFENAVSWTSDAGSSFMNLWDFGTNLNYYVNYTYPLGRPTWGSTSDQIVLKDGDIITAHLIVADKGSASGSNFPFFVVDDTNDVYDITEQDYKSTVTILDTVDTVTVKQGEKVDVTLYLANPGEGYTTAYTKQAGKVLYQIEEENLTSVVVVEKPEESEETGWNKTAYVTDENGKVTIDTSDLEAGIYYFGAEGGMTAGGQDLGDGFISKGGETGVAVLRLVVEAKSDTKADVTYVFSDVAKCWYTEYVQYVYDKGLMTGIKGTTRFEPNTNITKAQVAQILYNMENQPTVDDMKIFTELKDVYADEWYASAVAWAYNNGIITGDTSAMKFYPNADITREQLALMMFRYADYKGYDITAASVDADLLNVDKVNDWAAEAMSWAVGTGMISGVEDHGMKDLAPQGGATRAQMAAILQRFCENVK